MPEQAPVHGPGEDGAEPWFVLADPEHVHGPEQDVAERWFVERRGGMELWRLRIISCTWPLLKPTHGKSNYKHNQQKQRCIYNTKVDTGRTFLPGGPRLR